MRQLKANSKVKEMEQQNHKFPFFILIISFIQCAMFWKQVGDNPILKYNIDNHEQDVGIFEYDPKNRHEIWRFLTVMLVHSDFAHLLGNVSVQLVYGTILERVYSWRCVMPIYLIGVICGSLGESIVEPFNSGTGASDGVYAISFTIFIDSFLNRHKLGWRRKVLLAAIVLEGIYEYFFHYSSSHYFGALSGLLSGVIFLDTSEKLKLFGVTLKLVATVILINFTFWSIVFNFY